VSYYIGLPLIFFVALLEASVLPMFRVFDLQPNLTLVLVVAWLIIRGVEEAFVFIPFAGLMLGLVDGAPIGTALIALAPIVLLQELRGSHLPAGGLVMAMAFVVIMSFVYSFTYMFVFTVQGQSGDWIVATTRVIIPTAFINVMVLVPLYAVFSLVNPEQRRYLYA
jgi:cell shape-determining protein MreD